MLRDEGPLYARIERDIRQAIASGELVIGARVPTEQELCARYGVSRMTVRQALERLAAAGLVVRRRGVGTFVARDKIERVASRLLGFREDAIAHGLRPDTAVLSRGYEPVGEDDGSLLDVPPTDLVYRVTRLRTTDGEPIGLNVVVLLPDVAAELDGADYTASLYDEVARLLGREVARADQTVEAVNGREADCELLGVTPSAPLLRVTRVTYLDSGRLIGLTRTLYRGDRYYLSLRVDRSEPTMTG